MEAPSGDNLTFVVWKYPSALSHAVSVIEYPAGDSPDLPDPAPLDASPMVSIMEYPLVQRFISARS